MPYKKSDEISVPQYAACKFHPPLLGANWESGFFSL
jgi:hypothetical protein